MHIQSRCHQPEERVILDNSSISEDSFFSLLATGMGILSQVQRFVSLGACEWESAGASDLGEVGIH